MKFKPIPIDTSYSSSCLLPVHTLLSSWTVYTLLKPKCNSLHCIHKMYTVQKNEWLAGLRWLNVTVTSKWQIAFQIVVCLASLCNWLDIHYWLLMLCLMMSHSSWPQHNQSCGFCDAHRLYPTSLYTLTGCSDGHAKGKSGDEMFQYHTHTQAIPIWCFWGWHP